MPSKPKLGQNFLHDSAAIGRIIAALGDISTSTVVEIGPGRGALTRSLIDKAGHLVAVELDAELAAALLAQFPPDKLTVVQQDVLAFDFAAAAATAGHRLAVVGNLPYYITSPILLKLAAFASSLDRAVLMMQREVADRVCASPGTRDYGLLSVTAQCFGPVENLFTLPPSAFSPPPDVHSSVIRWRFAPRFQALAVDERRFLAFARQAFAQKRKTLSNNLRAAGYAPASIATALASTNTDPSVRAEQLSIETLAGLFKALAASS